MQTRRLVEKPVEVDGTPYRGVVYREPQWSSAEGWKGLCIKGRSLDDSGRTLLLELPFAKGASRSTPYRQRPRVVEADLKNQIREALAAGWAPESRGKPFVFEMAREA